MADPQAIMRAASKPPMAGGMGGGMPMMDKPPMDAPKPPMPGPGAAPGGDAPGGGVDAMVGNLEGVGAFLKAQADGGNPAAGEAMTHFQALLGSMAKLGEGGPGPGAQDLEQQPKPEGAVPDANRPGVKVL